MVTIWEDSDELYSELGDPNDIPWCKPCDTEAAVKTWKNRVEPIYADLADGPRSGYFGYHEIHEWHESFEESDPYEDLEDSNEESENAAVEKDKAEPVVERDSLQCTVGVVAV